MSIELQIVIALLLDLWWGDPRWLPHPVKLIGWMALYLETGCRRFVRNERLAGVLAVGSILGICGGAVWFVLWGAEQIHPLGKTVVSILLLYTTFATRDLIRHAMDVYRALKSGKLGQARQRVGRLVGRETSAMDETQVVRATVESVAESSCDGITAPIIYAFAFGPLGAMVYKIINTLDSMYGYRNDRYLRFGWAAARLDDVANYLPARLTGLIMTLAAGMLGLSPRRAFQIWRRDRRAHPSPNSGHCEAALAGALGVRLGGLNRYFGRQQRRPHMGDPVYSLSMKHIRQSVQLVGVTSVLVVAVCLSLRWTIWRLG